MCAEATSHPPSCTPARDSSPAGPHRPLSPPNCTATNRHSGRNNSDSAQCDCCSSYSWCCCCCWPFCLLPVKAGLLDGANCVDGATNSEPASTSPAAVCALHRSPDEVLSAKHNLALHCIPFPSVQDWPVCLTFFFSSVGGSGTLMRFMRSVNFTFNLQQQWQRQWQQRGTVKVVLDDEDKAERKQHAVTQSCWCLWVRQGATPGATTGLHTLHPSLPSQPPQVWPRREGGGIVYVDFGSKTTQPIPPPLLSPPNAFMPATHGGRQINQGKSNQRAPYGIQRDSSIVTMVAKRWQLHMPLAPHLNLSFLLMVLPAGSLAKIWYLAQLRLCSRRTTSSSW